MTRPMLSSFIKYGIPQKIASVLENKGLNLGVLRTAKKADLISKYELDSKTVDYVTKAIRRKEIPEETLLHLLEASNFTCCCCKGQKDGGYVIHHIDSYEKTQDNSYENLAVLCLICHDNAHTTGGLTNSISPEQIRKSKAKWEQRVEKRNIDTACKVGNVNNTAIDFINISRILELIDGVLRPPHETEYSASLFKRNLIAEDGVLTPLGRSHYTMWGNEATYNCDSAFLIRHHYYSLFKQFLNTTVFTNLDDLLGVRKLKTTGVGTYCYYIGRLYGHAPVLPLTTRTPPTQLYRKKKNFYINCIVDPLHLVSNSAAMRMGGNHVHLVYGVIRNIDEIQEANKKYVKIDIRPFLAGMPTKHMSITPDIASINYCNNEEDFLEMNT